MLSDGAEGAAAAVERNQDGVETDDEESRLFCGERGDAFKDEGRKPGCGNEDDDYIRCDLIQAALLNKEALVLDAGGGEWSAPFHTGGAGERSTPRDAVGPSLSPRDAGRGAISPPLIHLTAVVDRGAIIGERTKVWHFVHVVAGARIGAEPGLGQNVYVAGRAVVGDSVHV